jgi:transposase
MGSDWAAISSAEATARQARPTASPEPSVFGGHLVDFADGCGMALSAGRISFAFHLLAATAAVGGGRRLVGGMAHSPGCAGWGRSTAVGRDLLGRQLRSSQKGGSAVGKTKRGKGTKWMVLVDGQGLPLGVRLESASPAEVTLAEATLAEVRVPRQKGRPRQKPERIIADRGYDSDPLRQRLKKRGIDLIAPYRKNNQQRRYEDGRKLRRYVRRWIVERTNAWLGQFRRLLVRHEHRLSTYRAFFYLACFWITLRRCFWNTL